MLKKVFAILILFVIFINASLFIKNNVYALTNISNAIDMKTAKKEIKVGESITVSVYITGTASSSEKAMKSINMSLEYDSDLFECTDIVSPRNNYNYGTIAINDEGGKIIYTYNASGMRALGNGTTLVSITFKAKKDGASKMKLFYTATDSDSSKKYGENNVELSLNVEKDITSIIKAIPKYYVFDMDKIGDSKIDEYTAQEVPKYIEQVINDDSIKIEMDNLNGGGDYTFMEWAADVKVFKNGELSDTISLGWNDNTQITVLGLISITPDVKNTEEAYIAFAKNQIENKYNWDVSYELEKYDGLKDKDIVLLDTEKFGTVKYKGEDLQNNIFAFIPDGGSPEPLVLMQESASIMDINGDGKINLKDLNMLYEYVNETIELNSEELQRADVNGDGKVNAQDLNKLYEYIIEIKDL